MKIKKYGNKDQDCQYFHLRNRGNGKSFMPMVRFIIMMDTNDRTKRTVATYERKHNISENEKIIYLFIHQI